MELYQLRTFLTVADEGHLTRAAEKLFTSQPAVSGQIRALEEELGIRLFERSAKGMTLTAAGVRMRDQARRIVEAARDFKQQAEGLRKEVAGELILGLNNSPEILRLMPILRILTEQHPSLAYDLVTGSSGVILQGLDEGTISAGFFEGACSNPRIAFDTLARFDLCLVAPKAWAEELSAPDWKLLEKKPWVFVSPLCAYFRAIEHLCNEQGLGIKARFRADEDITALQLVAEGMAITITSRAQLRNFADRDSLFVLPHFNASLPLCLGYLESRAEDPAIRALRDATARVWADAKVEGPVSGDVQIRMEPAIAQSPRPVRGLRTRRTNS
jgi:DNA-binding transcriptional LysR family regulator